MRDMNSPLEQVLKRRGVTDAEGLVMSKGGDAPMKRSDDPDVRARGSILLMMGRKTTRKKVDAGLAKLEYL